MTALSRRHLLAGGLAAGGAAALGAGALHTPEAAARPRDRSPLRRWASDTWVSMVAMTDERTGLTADNIEASVTDPVRSGYTSPTNVGGYLWSTVVARELGLIGRRESLRRLHQTLDSLAGLRHHRPSGMFYNWYDEATGAVLTRWPTDGNRVDPFLSSVDNGWLAAGLMVVRRAEPRLAEEAGRLLRRMNFGAFYDPEPTDHGDLGSGLLRGGFWDAKPGSASVPGNLPGTDDQVWFTPNYYDTTVSETRIASYIAIARGQVPPEHYYATWRVLPLDRDWQEQRPVGRTRRYRGIDVFEGAYSYRGMRIVPGWGGSMFEALMPDVFVPEERWAPHSWGVNHPLTVRAHREHGLAEAGYGYWGFSPASQPGGGYREYGVDAIGMNPDGYFSDVERTNVDLGFGDRPGTNPHPDFGDGVVTPHAAFLALHHEPREAMANLQRMERELDVYGDGGFYDAVAVGSGTVAKRYLSLDQAMVLGSIGNVAGHEVVRRAFSRGAVERTVRPLIAPERFGAGLVGG